MESLSGWPCLRWHINQRVGMLKLACGFALLDVYCDVQYPALPNALWIIDN